MKHSRNAQAIIYQIYPMSFMDTNKDGYGDLKGIIKQLPYISWMGFTHIWLCPIYKTQFFDNGYDVIDFYDIDSRFGTMHDFENLLQAAQEQGLKVIMDMVVGYSSNQSAWFKNSENKDPYYDDFFIWSNQPNAMVAQFENKAWSFSKTRNQYFFHHFSRHQPDLNWANPNVSYEFVKILNFWMHKGVGGFRFDVVDTIGKDINSQQIINISTAYSRIKKLGKQTWLKRKDIFTVGESWSTLPDDAIKYINLKNGVFTTAFNGHHMFLGWEKSRWVARPFGIADLQKLKTAVFSIQKYYYKKVHPAVFIENHDFPRAISRWFASHECYQAKAKVLAVSFYGLRGIPFIFQGQEAGFPNPTFRSIKAFNDPETNKFLHNTTSQDAFKMASFGSRDNARVFMKWDDNMQFETTWNQNAFYDHKVKSITALLKDHQSSIYLYKKIINLRKKYHELFEKGQVEKYDFGKKGIFGYTITWHKTTILFIANWYEEKCPINLVDYVKIIGNTKNKSILRKYDFFIGLKQ